MEYRKFGRTDMNVSVLGLGGWEIGYQHISLTTVKKLMSEALDAGINIIETAECYATSEELIAHNRSVDEIREFLEVDSLAYLSLEGLLRCMRETNKDKFCTACWSGRYKIPIDNPQTKFSFERDQLKMF